MSHNSKKKRIAAGAILAVLTLSASPSAVLALQQAPVGNAGGTAFCTTLPTKIDAVVTKLAANKQKVQTAWSNQDTKLTEAASATNAKVADARTKAAAARQKEFAALEAKATTDEQKQAVKTYEAAVQQAVTKRQAAYDAARQAFRDGVKSAITTHRTIETSQVTAFLTSASQAANTAKTECADGSATAATRTTLLQSLKTARQTFVSQRKDDAKVSTQIKALITTRNAAFEQANADFKTALQDAAVKAFPEKFL